MLTSVVRLRITPYITQHTVKSRKAQDEGYKEQ